MSTVVEDAPPTTDYVIPDATPDAPYGFFKNGSPRKTPPKGVAGPRKQREEKLAKGATDYRPALMGLAQVGAFITSFFSPVQAWTISEHSKPISNAVNKTAQEDMRLAAVLDKLKTTGPYAEIIAATVPFAIQVLHNIGRLPAQAAIQMGGKSREQIEADLDRAAREAYGNGEVPTG